MTLRITYLQDKTDFIMFWKINYTPKWCQITCTNAMSGFETVILRTWSEHSITVLIFIYLVFINMKVNVIYCIIEWVLSNNGINWSIRAANWSIGVRILKFLLQSIIKRRKSDFVFYINLLLSSYWEILSLYTQSS